jgi:acyl transferase domain-containing protein/NAD(P)-dependent dehydrogenase (short-subunit alcohol dehydrogenase family)/acyl carrier protein
MTEHEIMRDDVAVIGMACRYPGGANTPEALWELVREARDAIGDFPDNRGWDTAALYGPEYTRQGGFLYDADLFDAAFFNIAPSEVLAMDPQHRILLEVAWEAIERTGIVPSSLKGSSTGVFIGLMPNEYGMPIWKWQQGETAGYMATGTSPSVASGRLSYLLGLEGPAVTFDTACSSSGVAIHSAVRSLRSGETDLALVGGCNVLAGPGIFVDFAKKNALSLDARCRSFSETANGTVWSEGVGILVLEPLSKARRLGHHVIGVIRGTAVNQDGASNGLTAPSGRAQIKVIKQALADAGLEPQDIQLVEAHATGTKLGDPIEANGICATYGRAERESPVWIGSLKSNIGHTMAAAGVAGVIKCLLAMKAREMPRTLHIEGLNSNVDWPASVDVLRDRRPWPARDGVRRCAVSTFGVSGTNSHIILEGWDDGADDSWPEAALAGGSPEGESLLKISAKTSSALRSYAQAVAATLGSSTDPVPAVAHCLATEREDFDHRSVVIGKSREELCGALQAFAADPSASSAIHGEAQRIGRPVFVFPGQGSQWVGMAAGLLAESEVFRLRIEECAAAFKPYLAYDVVAVLSGDDHDVDMERSDVIQPLIFSVMLALAAMWRSVGVEPAAVVGHSQGEVAAACLAGVLDLREAARVVVCRSRTLEQAGCGGMAAIAASEEETTALLADVGADLVIAAINGPKFVVVSGADEPGIQRLLDLCDDRGIYARRVPVKAASHSPVMDELRGQIVGELASVVHSAATIPIFSTVDSKQLRGEELNAEYWYRNLRSQVRFAQTIAEMASRGYDAFIEISPHPVLAGSIRSVLESLGNSSPVCVTMKRDQGTRERFMAAVGEAYVQGHSIDWSGLRSPADSWHAGSVELPTYPFERQRYWLPMEMGMEIGHARTASAEKPATLVKDGGHPWISSVIETADGTVIMAGQLSIRSHPWLLDHQVQDTVLLPGTAFVELLLSAGREMGCAGIEELLLSEPLLLPMDGSAVQIQVSLGSADDQGSRSAAVFSRTVGGDGWLRNAEGLLSGPNGSAVVDPGAASTMPNPRALQADGLYELLSGMGYGYGEAFRGVRSGEHQGDRVRSRVALPAKALINHSGFAVHPALVDAALHAAVGCGLLGEANAGDIAVPFVFKGVRRGRETGGALNGREACYATATRVGPNAVTVTLTDEAGTVLLAIERVVVRELNLSRGARPDPDQAGLYKIEWDEPAGADGAVSDCLLCVVGADEGPLSALVRKAALGGISVATLEEAIMIVTGSRRAWQVVLPCPVSGSGLLEQIHASAQRVLDMVQAWVQAEDLSDGVLLTFLTQDSIAVPGDENFGLADSAVWGMIRSAQSEHPGQFRVVDVGGTKPVDAAALKNALRRTNPQLAVRAGKVLEPRIAAYQPSSSELVDVSTGTVVITGGTGTIGRAVAKHLAAQWGVGALTLLSRSGPQSPGTAELRAELERLGAAVQVIAADVADPDDLRGALAEARSAHPIIGVVHAAGVLDDSIIANMTPDQLRTVLKSKVDSALNLDAATLDDKLRFFMLFSSLYTVLGAPGQANYAGANAFLDQFAAWRRSKGRPANAVAWGLWAQATGMTGHLDESDLLRLRRNGVGSFTVSEGLALFDTALTDGAASVIGGRLAFPDAEGLDDLDVPLLLTTLAGRRAKDSNNGKRHRDKLRPASASQPSVLPVPEQRSREEGEGGDGVLALLASAQTSGEQRVAGLLAIVKDCVAGLLGVKPGQVDARKSFYEMGFDSLKAMELRTRLKNRLKIRLDATVVFDYPTPEAIVAHLVELFGPPSAETQTAPQPKTSPEPQAQETDRPATPSGTESESFPLTKLQEAYLAGRTGDFELGNVSTYLYAEVDLVRFDVKAAERALRLLVERHEMLRAIFEHAGTQRVLPDVPAYPILVEDLRHLGADERAARLSRIHEELKGYQFDTSQWPLFVVRATRVDDAVTRLHVGIDVLISDGASSTLLFNEWGRLYRDPTAALESPGALFRDYVLKVNEYRASEQIEPSRKYWQDRVPLLPPAPELPLAVKLGDVVVPAFASRFIRVDAPDWDMLKRNAAAAGLTPSSAILCAYCQVLARYSKTPDFTINVLVSLRKVLPEADTSKVVGNFSSTSLLEVHVDPAAPFREVAVGIQRQLMRDMEHAPYSGLDVLRDLSRLDGDAGRARMPVVFNSTIGSWAQPTSAAPLGPVSALCRLGESGTPVWIGMRTPQVILDHQAFEEEGCLILNWDVVEEIFPAGVVNSMFAEYEGLIHELCR